MNDRFMERVESLEGAFQELMSMKPVPVTALPHGMPSSGIYVFFEVRYISTQNERKMC
jgi:hypothetical protein